MTRTQEELLLIMERIVRDEGTTMQNALRDLLTDLWHVADQQSLDIELAIDGSEEVFEEETINTSEDEDEG